jgi:hypothetical protein
MMFDQANSSSSVVQILLRANPDDRIVVDGVSIDDHAGLSIRFVVVSCLTNA